MLMFNLSRITIIKELENEKTMIETRILIEKEKIKEQLSQADIRKYLTIAVSQNRKRLVELLIRQITVFNDRIKLLLKYKKDDTPPEQPKRGRKKRNDNKYPPAKPVVFHFRAVSPILPAARKPRL